MSKLVVQDNRRTIRATASRAVTSGLACKVGSMILIATMDVANGAVGDFAVDGVHDVAKASGAAWTEGELIYWDDSAHNFTPTSTSNTLAGVAVLNDSDAMAASADTTGRLMLRAAFG